MHWGIVLGLVVASLAVWLTTWVSSTKEGLRRRLDENEAHIAELRATLAEQRADLDGHEQALADITSSAGKPAGPAVVVYNPTKNADFDHLKDILAQVAADAGLPEPIWLATTADDPGAGQTREALEMGASVVIAAGGDGTVRNVGEVLAGTDTPLGLLPVGTGNLLARNLSLPFNSARRMAVIALTGRESAIDVGWLDIPPPGARATSGAHAQVSPSVDGKLGADSVPVGTPATPGANAQLSADADSAPVDTPAEPGTYAFLVAAGLGFDANIMASADEESELKEKIGWLAYVKAALPHLLAAKMRATISTGKEVAPMEVESRSVMMLNCGELVGGFVLDPNARPDDGWLELAVLNTRRGLLGWGDVIRKVGLNGLGVNSMDVPGIESLGDIDVRRVNSATILADSPQLVQVDGDVLGLATNVSGRIEEGALRVRVI